jgi:LysM repeat protein
MRKILPGFAIVLTVLIAVSCASTGSASGSGGGSSSGGGGGSQGELITQAQVDNALERIYAEYRDDIILDGAKEYTVKSGDTLSRIARDQYGSVDNAYYFPLIMLASRNVVADPDLIEPGSKLTVPDLQKNLNDASARREIKRFLKDVAGVYENRARGEQNGNKKKNFEDLQTRLTALSNSL